jgi:hypothetical protein
VLIHFHIYKNAGSSIDRLLWESFGDRFEVLDPVPGCEIIGGATLRDYLLANPRLKAVSSHRIVPPALLRGALPIIMLRHPADRARSAYRFARRNPDMPDHSIAAASSFAEYVAWSLATRGHGAVLRDHQVGHLSGAPHQGAQETTRFHLEQVKALLASLPAFGIVRQFAQSCRLFNARYRPFLPGARFMSWAENFTGDVTQDDAEALSDIRAELGEPAFAALADANRLDLELYSFAKTEFAKRLARLDRPGARLGWRLALIAGRARQRLKEPQLYRATPLRHPVEPAYVRLGEPDESPRS